MSPDSDPLTLGGIQTILTIVSPLVVYIITLVIFVQRAKALADKADAGVGELTRQVDQHARKFENKFDLLAKEIRDLGRQITEIMAKDAGHSARIEALDKADRLHQRQLDRLEERVYGVTGQGVRGDPSQPG